MNGLSFQDLPAAQQQQFNQSKKYLEEQFAIEGKALDNTPMRNDQYQGKLNQLRAKYQKILHNTHFKIQQQAQEQQRVQQLIKQPRQYTRGQEAGLRMELGPEAERLVFPTQKYLSPQYLRSRGFIENLSGYSEAAVDTPGWEWGPPKKKKGSLIDQYRNWRQSELYSTKSLQERQQLDQEWDMTMATNSTYDNWWQDKKTKRKPIVDVQILRATGRIAGAMRDKVISPIGRSLGRKKKTGLGTQWGYSPLGLGGAEQEPIRQRNKRTGQERISYNGGKTWKVTG